MIAFASLWLGLVTGTMPVEVLAGPEVARIEVRLDGETCAALAEPPWKTTCELGSELAPHELVAQGFARDGQPVAVARQWLNLPHPAAELEVTVAAEGSPPRPVARLAWAGPAGADPTAVRATLDGLPLPPGPDLHRLELPAARSAAARLLRVEVTFAGGEGAVRELALGGDISEEIADELTGVPVEVDGRAPHPTLVEDGSELPVVALESGDADVLAVIDPGAVAALAKLANDGRRGHVTRYGQSRGAAQALVSETSVVAPMPPGTLLRMVWPVSETRQGGDTRYDLFPTSPERTAGGGGLLDQLALASSLPAGSAPPRVADAVAVGGLEAAEPGRRRVLLLVLGEGPSDAGTYQAAEARRFLERLRVPLVVWSTTAPSPATSATWGDVEAVTSVPRFAAAARRLYALLERQRIAWVSGRHLPQRLTAPPGGGLRLANAQATSLDVAAGPLAESFEELAPEEPAAGTAETSRVEPPPPSVPATLARRPLPPFELATDVHDDHLLATMADVATALPEDFSARLGLHPHATGTILLFAQAKDFRDWLAAQGGGDAAVDGYARGGFAAVAVERFQSAEVAGVLVHELAHLLTRAAAGRVLPPWLEEGIAEELSMSRRDASGHSLPGTLRSTSSSKRVGLTVPGRAAFEVTLGGPVAALVALSRGARPSLDALLATPQDRFVTPSGRAERYATSAFFVRFLLDGDDGRWRDRFRAYLTAAAAGGAVDRPSLEAALGTPLPLLQSRFDSWLHRSAAALR